MEDSQSLLEHADSTSRCTWRRNMCAPIFLALGALVLFTVPLRNPQKNGLQVTQLDQDLNFTAMAKELAHQLQILRDHADGLSNRTLRFLGPPEMGGPPDLETVRGRIFELLPFFDKISPFAAAELGILITEDDLPLLGESAPKDLVDSNDDIEDMEGEPGEHPKPLERRLSFGPGTPWKGGHVPFCFDQSMLFVPHETQSRVIEGMRAWEKAVGCLSFEEVSFEYQEDYSIRCEVQPSIYITANTTGHWSHVGSQRGHVEMNFDISSVAFSSKNPGERSVSIGIIIHELGHALGMVHEHQRKDRDMYVEVLKNNFNSAFEDKWKTNYAINPKADTQRPYDVLSIMHYGSGAGGTWSQNSQPLLRARKRACWTYGVRGDGHGEECERIRNSMGQRMGMTQLDADQVAALYRSDNYLCKSSFALGSMHIHDLGRNNANHWPSQRWLPRTTQIFNTISMQEMSTVRCWQPGQFWLATDGGGELGFDHDGFLKFWPGKGGEPEERVRQHNWDSADCGGSRRRRRYCKKGGRKLCLQPDGNLVIYSGKGPNGEPTTDIWQSQTKNMAVGLVVYDQHWAMIGRDPHRHYVNHSIFSYPAGAPVTMEVGSWGSHCYRGSSWETPQGTRLAFENGNLEFSTKHFCKDGNYRLLWESNTRGRADCLRFSKGQLVIVDDFSQPNADSKARTDSHLPARKDVILPMTEQERWKIGEGIAEKIVISTYEWFLVDRLGRVLTVYPTSFKREIPC